MDEKAYWDEIYRQLYEVWPQEMEPFGFCDWIEPRKYVFGSYKPHAEGKLRLIGGQKSQLSFVLYFDGKPEELAEVAWSSLVPQNKVESWLSYDADSDTLELDPAGVA